MEITLIFLFFAVAVILVLLAKLFEARILMGGAFIILLFLAFQILNNGYEIQGTRSSTAFNYTFNPITSTQDLTQMYVNKSESLSKVQNEFTLMFGYIIFFLAFIIGLIGAFK